MKKETAKRIASVIGYGVAMAAEVAAGAILARLLPIKCKANLAKRILYTVGLTGINATIGFAVDKTMEDAVLDIVEGVDAAKEFIEDTVKNVTYTKSPSEMDTDCVVDEGDISEECDTDEDETVENVCIEFGKYYSEKLAIMMLSSFTGNQNGYLMYDVDTGTLRHSADMNYASPGIIYWDAKQINNIAHVAHLDDGWTVVLPKPINYKTWKLATRLPCKKKGDDA